jgi:hypothetical protein
MIRANAHRFGAIRTLVSVGLLAIGVVASTARPGERVVPWIVVVNHREPPVLGEIRSLWLILRTALVG